MIKITQAKWIDSNQLELHFSDGSHGIMDFSSMIKRSTSLTLPLKEREYFKRYFIELGALCWPNGLEFSAASLHQKIDAAGQLNKPEAA